MKRQTILLVEDDRWLSDMYGEALSEYKVIKASSSEKALELVDKNKFDLILLDVFLPGHNGIELIHELASYDDSANIPVIILSAVSKADFGLPEARFKHYSIVDYLYKPNVKPSDVAEVVKLHLTHFVVV